VSKATAGRATAAPYAPPTEADIIAALPASVRKLVVLLGYVPTMQVIQHFGGERLYVPTTMSRRAGARLLAALGTKAAGTLVAARGGKVLEVPLPTSISRRVARPVRDTAVRVEFDAAIAAGTAKHQAIAALVSRYEITARTVWRILADRRAVPPR